MAKEACSAFFLSVSVVAYLGFMVVLVLSGAFGTTRTVELRVTPSYALADCAPPSPAPPNSSSAFGQSLLPQLLALPSAAAPTGFASLQSGGAFVRGLCLGESPDKDCPVCLDAAAWKLTRCFVDTSRRAGVWRSEGCFLAYADANASSGREDAFRHVFSAGGQDQGEGPSCFDPHRLVAVAQSMASRGAANVSGAQVATDAADLLPGVARGTTTLRVLAQCAQDRAAECARCLGDSARKVPPCSWGLDGAHARVVDVVGYSCFLRMETSVPPRPAKPWITKPFAITLCVLLPVIAVFSFTAAITISP